MERWMYLEDLAQELGIDKISGVFDGFYIDSEQ